MTKPGRIPCINPRCRITAPVAQDGASDIICRKCWKALPVAMRSRYQQLQRRQKRLLKLIERRILRGNISRDLVLQLERQLTDRCAENWGAIRNYFTTPDKPVGLEGFLQEIGL